MKITVKTTQTKDVIIGIPSFTIVNGDYFAVLTPNKVIKVWHSDNINSTIITNNNEPKDAYSGSYEIITREQFFTEYERVIDHLYDDMENAKFIAKDESEYEGVNEICEHSAKMEEEA